MKIFIKAILGVAVWFGFFYFYAVKISGSNAGVNMLVFFSSFALLLIFILWISGVIEMAMSGIRREKLLKSGTAASGCIVSCEKTGVKMSVNSDYPRYGAVLVIDIETSDGEKFQASTKMMLPEHELAGIRPGKQVQVRFDPRNRNNVIIE